MFIVSFKMKGKKLLALCLAVLAVAAGGAQQRKSMGDFLADLCRSPCGKEPEEREIDR